MKTLHKQLVLNKREDWRIAMGQGVCAGGDSLTLCDGAAHGFVCLKAVDAGENGFAWGRLSIGCHMPKDSLIRTWAYASDSKAYGDAADLDALLGGTRPQTEEAAALLGGLYRLSGDGEDFDLALSGRYLWLMFELIAPGRPPVIEAVRLHMPGDHMMDYMPAVYRKNGDFTRRFLSVFDGVLMDMEREIYALPARFDYENADGGMLDSLARWVCVDPARQERETVVSRIRTALSDYEEMYTVRGVTRSVERLCGRRPLIIESAQVDPNRPDCANSALYRRLYGENPYKFFVLLEEDAFKTREQMEEFIERMRGLIPAGTEFELVLLKRCVQLDWHTYLGVNAMVSDYVPVVIDENKTIHYDTMIGGNEH